MLLFGKEATDKLEVFDSTGVMVDSEVTIGEGNIVEGFSHVA